MGDVLTTLGIDPGASCGLAVVTMWQGDKRRYEVLHHSTVKTDANEPLSLRLRSYALAVGAVLPKWPDIKQAYIEVPWHGQSIYTRGARNVYSLGVLLLITGAVIAECHRHEIDVIEVPAPIGKRARNWEKQMRWQAEQLTNFTGGTGHEAVAVMLAVKGAR